ncbi:hypothetical protein BHM03_00019869 [Ensete ventricosum]|nr:hypothetical protein BHM03_00019869 [Ensete ventricosum]
MVPCARHSKRGKRGIGLRRLGLILSAVERASLPDTMVDEGDRSLAMGDPKQGEKVGGGGDGPCCRGLMHPLAGSCGRPGDRGGLGLEDHAPVDGHKGEAQVLPPTSSPRFYLLMLPVYFCWLCRIIRAFLVEEQKIVKKVLKMQKAKEKQASKEKR